MPLVIARDKGEAFAQGSDATKQSSFFVAKHGLLREPVIGRRVAPTRWLAMTV